jgi:hypothetical protein
MSDCPQQQGTGYGAQCGHLQALLAEVVVSLERGEGERLARTIDHVNRCGAHDRGPGGGTRLPPG